MEELHRQEHPCGARMLCLVIEPQLTGARTVGELSIPMPMATVHRMAALRHLEE